jgi:uncharacterized damage-inducible protein DinB
MADTNILRAAFLKELETEAPATRKCLERISEKLVAEIHLKLNGKLLVTVTQKDNLSGCINHMVHHRGQLSVYMRLNNIAVPSIYGPSADERGF